MNYVIVIPARYDSVRLPGKALADINGKPMIQRTWECAMASGASRVVVATDDERIVSAVEGFGGEVFMTSREHESGSDRIAECARLAGWDEQQLIVNLQGDEPEMPASCLEQVAGLVTDNPQAVAGTLYWPVANEAEALDPNVVKVVTDEAGQALCFSRSLLPFPRAYQSVGEAIDRGERWYRHLGIYCYRNASLQAFTQRKPSRLEQLEKLEQMRFLESGGRIMAQEAHEMIPPGIDTPQDLEKARLRIK